MMVAACELPLPFQKGTSLILDQGLTLFKIPGW